MKTNSSAFATVLFVAAQSCGFWATSTEFDSGEAGTGPLGGISGNGGNAGASGGNRGGTGGKGGAENGPGEGGGGEPGVGGAPADGGASGDVGASGDAGSGEPNACGTSTPGMVCIPGGTFIFQWATPFTGPITIDAFELDITEVTVFEYKRCVEAGACRGPLGRFDDTGRSCNYATSGNEQHPIDCVDWDAAVTFCEWAGKRLPTEEEEEYAAQRPDGREYPWGSSPPSAERVNACGLECSPDGVPWNDGFAQTAPVGSFPAGDSFDGLKDLSGNAYEWTATFFCSERGLFCGECGTGGPCSSACEGCEVLHPVAHGGCYLNLAFDHLRSTMLSEGPSNNIYSGLGFRCAR